MERDTERIERIGKDDFLDDDGPEPRRIRSGRGAVEGVAKKGSRRERPGPFEPQILCGPDGRLGWRISLPGGRPLATPAIADGTLFAGGGFGSHEFYALDAETGSPAWRLKTKDDGPTAATVLGDYVAFNTESCTVYVVDARTGSVVWESWLGDPLMAQTALDGSLLFMVYPDRQRRHQLAAFDIASGKARWRTELVADVITAPIVAEGSVYAASIDGTVYRIDRDTGKVLWSQEHRATSAPWVHKGRLFMSLREEVREARSGRTYAAEAYDTATIRQGARAGRVGSSRRKAEYLRYKKSLQDAAYQKQDAGVGFAGKPAAAKMAMAEGHLGLGHVASVWSFQGSRPAAFDDGIFCVLDDVAQRLDVDTKKPIWRVRVESDDAPRASRLLSPPAVTGSRLYFTSSLGDLFVLDRTTGEELWALNVGEPVLSQPAVAEGKVFFGTLQGSVFAFEVDDTDAAGWPMWGGGPGHNGAVN